MIRRGAGGIVGGMRGEPDEEVARALIVEDGVLAILFPRMDKNALAGLTTKKLPPLLETLMGKREIQPREEPLAERFLEGSPGLFRELRGAGQAIVPELQFHRAGDRALDRNAHIGGVPAGFRGAGGIVGGARFQPVLRGEKLFGFLEGRGWRWRGVLGKETGGETEGEEGGKEGARFHEDTG